MGVANWRARASNGGLARVALFLFLLPFVIFTFLVFFFYFF